MGADCSFKQHIDNMCQSAKNMCSLILRTFQSRSPDVMLTLWKSMVLPILDYCSQLWSPTKVGEIQQIEQVQKNFTRKIKSNSQEDYWCRLSRNNLYSLEKRRERYRIIYVWKILEGMVPNLSGQSELRAKPSLRFGRMCSVPPRPASASARIQNLRDGSFSINGPHLISETCQESTYCDSKMNLTSISGLLQMSHFLPATQQDVELHPTAYCT